MARCSLSAKSTACPSWVCFSGVLHVSFSSHRHGRLAGPTLAGWNNTCFSSSQPHTGVTIHGTVPREQSEGWKLPSCQARGQTRSWGRGPSLGKVRHSVPWSHMQESVTGAKVMRTNSAPPAPRPLVFLPLHRIVGSPDVAIFVARLLRRSMLFSTAKKRTTTPICAPGADDDDVKPPRSTSEAAAGSISINTRITPRSDEKTVLVTTDGSNKKGCPQRTSVCSKSHAELAQLH